MHLILFVLIGLIAGALAGRVVSGHGYGMLEIWSLGVVGAFLGGWLSPSPSRGRRGLHWSACSPPSSGAVILLWVISTGCAGPRLES